jgi:hypothetical protein
MKRILLVLILIMIGSNLYATGQPNRPIINKLIKQITVTPVAQTVTFNIGGYRDISTDAVIYLDEAGTTPNSSDRKIPANTLYDSGSFFTTAQNWKVISEATTSNVIIKVYDYQY